MNPNDILGLGKVLPVDKLFDTVSKFIGKISKPYFDRKDVDTRAYEIKKLKKASAEADAEKIKIITAAVKENSPSTGGIEYKDENLLISSPKDLPVENQQQNLINPPLEERAQERINFQEAKQQINIENVITLAAKELKNEAPVTDEPLDEDWITRFFRITEDVSIEKMQALWGKILAGEIKQPKSYSLRTLEVIRNLSKNEADIFAKVADFAIKGTDFAIKGADVIFLFSGKHRRLLEKYNIPYTDIALLTEAGLLQPGTSTVYNFFQDPNDQEEVFTSGKISVFINIKANTPTFEIPIRVFSTAGKELLRLIESNPPIDYLASLAKLIKKNNKNVEVKYACILGSEENSTQYSELMDFDEQ